MRIIPKRRAICKHNFAEYAEKEKRFAGAKRLRLSKTMKSSWTTEQQGKSEGGKEPPSRSISQFFELFLSSKNCLSGAKRLFRHAEALCQSKALLGKNVSPQKPCESNYNLHERAGGLPLCCFSASNVHHRSEPWAGGLQSTAKVPASPEYNVGLSGPVTHPAGTRLLRSHILLWAAEAAFMPPALPRPRRSDPSAHCRPPQALRRLQWPQGIPRRFPPRT